MFIISDDVHIQQYDGSMLVESFNGTSPTENVNHNAEVSICSVCTEQKGFCFTHKTLVCRQCCGSMHSQCVIKTVADSVKRVSDSEYSSFYSTLQFIRADLIQVETDLGKNISTLTKSKEDFDKKLEMSYESAKEKLDTDFGKLKWDNQETYDTQRKKLQDSIAKVKSVKDDFNKLLSNVKYNQHKPMDEMLFIQIQEEVERITASKKAVPVLQNGLQRIRLASNINANYQPLKPKSQFGSVHLEKTVHTEKLPDITFPLNKAATTKRKQPRSKNGEDSPHAMKDSAHRLPSKRRKSKLTRPVDNENETGTSRKSAVTTVDTSETETVEMREGDISSQETSSSRSRMEPSALRMESSTNLLVQNNILERINDENETVGMARNDHHIPVNNVVNESHNLHVNLPVGMTLVGKKTVHLEGDKKACWIESIDVFPDDRIIMVDGTNDKVKMLTLDGIVRQLPVYDVPRCITCFDTNLAVLGCERKMYWIDILGDRMTFRDLIPVDSWTESIKSLTKFDSGFLISSWDYGDKGRIEKRKVTGEYEWHLNKGKHGQTIFEEPRSMTINTDGNLVVTDVKMDRIYIMDCIKKEVIEYYRNTNRCSQFYSVTTDNDDNIFAICLATNEVIVLDKTLSRPHVLKAFNEKYPLTIKYYASKRQLILSYARCNEIEFYQLEYMCS